MIFHLIIQVHLICYAKIPTGLRDAYFFNALSINGRILQNLAVLFIKELHLINFVIVVLVVLTTARTLRRAFSLKNLQIKYNKVLFLCY